MVAEEEVILEWPKGEKFRITKVAGFEQFKMDIKEKNDWFEVKGELKVDENLVLNMQQLLKLKRLWYCLEKSRLHRPAKLCN